ncbi:hypothetical protein GCM10009718_19800 [Isoptericola halotolerans]|uniref:SHOCT domain-containing protein n=1 Tax=Isoptericola halotolerans TaxID=300560 RepID=A0ABX2A701_9MICO|nr:hypothetical protein [Isoptericola halotolerans]NOV98436.1 hypothetical protein [Isoptericola halotolerans]
MGPEELHVDDLLFDDVGPGLVGGGDPFGSVFTLVVVLIVVGVVVSIVMAVRRAKTLHDAGVDPLDPQTDLQVRMARRLASSPDPASKVSGASAPAPAPTAAPAPEERLAEVDRLHRAGTISDTERDTARQRILGAL